MKTSTQHLSFRFKPRAVLAASVMALFGVMSGAANAQTFTPTPNQIFVAEGGDAGAYVTTTRRDIVRSGYGLCVRTGFWSVESAMATKVEGSPFSAGCACDEPLMPAGACTAKVVPVPPRAEAPAPAPAPAPVATSEKVTIPADALFAFDKATLSADGKTKLENFAQQLKNIKLEAVVAVGHTDRIGTPAYNLKLSNERAQTVKDFLISQGVAADRVFIEGRGETDPVTGDTCKNGKAGESGRNKALVDCLAPDRRVVIEAVGSRAR